MFSYGYLSSLPAATGYEYSDNNTVSGFPLSPEYAGLSPDHHAGSASSIRFYSASATRISGGRCDTINFLQKIHRLALLSWPQNFCFSTSCRNSLSRLRSATSLFSHWFSSSNCRRRHSSVMPGPENFFLIVQGGLRNPHFNDNTPFGNVNGVC